MSRDMEEKTKYCNDNKSKIIETNNSRRLFIKKAVYVAPTLIALGTLVRPTSAKADFGPPPSAPDWN